MVMPIDNHISISCEIQFHCYSRQEDELRQSKVAEKCGEFLNYLTLSDPSHIISMPFAACYAFTGRAFNTSRVSDQSLIATPKVSH